MAFKGSYTLLSVSYQRLMKDLDEMNINRKAGLVSEYRVSFPIREGLKFILPVHFKVVNEESIYRGANFDTVIKILPGFPYKPPEMLVLNQVYHPNISFETGQVFMRILTPEAWDQNFSIEFLILSFDILLLTPELDFACIHPVNNIMKSSIKNSYINFLCEVKSTLEGGVFFDKIFLKNYGPDASGKRCKVLDGNTKKIKYSEI